MDDTVYRAILFDFYGGLLTDKQREYYNLHYNEDLSLAEIAEQSEISRQGVWDTINRAEQILRDAEDKIGFVKYCGRVSSAVDAAKKELVSLMGSGGAAENAALRAAAKLDSIFDAEVTNGV